MNFFLRPARFASDGGFIFPLVLSAAIVIFILVFGLVTYVQTESKLTNKFVDYAIAEQIADSGVEQTLFYLKTRKDLYQGFVEALSSETEKKFLMPDELYEEVRAMHSGRGSYNLELQVQFSPSPSPFPDEGAFAGDLKIISRGIWKNALNEEFVREITAVFGVKGVYMGIVAPEHGLFLREPEHLTYRFDSETVEPSQLSVFNGNVYVKNGITAELSDYIIRKMIEKNELTWEEYYYMDHPPASTGLMDGGIDFLESNLVEYENNSINRRFKMFGREITEKYSKNTYPSSGFYTDKQIKLRSKEFYKAMASTVLEPRSWSSSGNSRDDRYFKSVIFEGERGFNSVRYNNVLPLYGYGDWRRVPVFDPERYGQRNRSHDFSNAVNIDGITYVRGDVFIEGYYEGVGLLVVEGNVYIGGDLKTLATDYVGHPSLLNIIVFEDSARETGYTPTDHPSFKKTGHVIIKPHPDNDWSEAGGQDPSPRPIIHAAIYTKNGLQTDKEAWRDNTFDLGSFDLTLKHNLVADAMNMNFIPKDIYINGDDPDREFEEFGGTPVSDFIQPEISTVIKTWSVRTVGNENHEESEG